MGRPRKKTLPEAGAAFAVPLTDGRYGLCRVLRVAHGPDLRSLGGPAVLVACSAWISKTIPDLSDPALRTILKRTHHDWNGEPEIFWVDDPPPRSFRPLGTIIPTADERKTKCHMLGDWDSAQFSPLLQWRWDHDRAAVLAEDAHDAEVEQRQARKRELAAAKELKAITLEKLRIHRFFRDWVGPPPKEAIRASRALMKQTVKALIALGAQPTLEQRMLVLRECIEGFNTLNRSLGGFIETMERDDICLEFGRILHACGLGKYSNLADEWRDW